MQSQERALVYAFVEESLQWDENTIYARTAGNGPPVVLLHSLGGTSEHWQYTQPFLAAQGYRVTAVDLPGHGRSGLAGVGLSPRRMGVALAGGLNAPALLVGNSLGGWVALEAYLARPERVLGLVLVASAGLAGMPIRPPKLRMSLSTDLAAYLLSLTFHRPEILTPAVRESFLKGVLAPALLGLVPENPLSLALLERVRVPTLVLWGAEDQILPASWAESFARSLPLCKKVILSECGHLPQLECPRQFNRELAAFAELFQPR